MDSYEKVLDAADSAGVDVIDYRFSSPKIRGLYCDGTAALSTGLRTTKEKSCILAEELGHFHTTAGTYWISQMLETGNRNTGQGCGRTTV